MNMDNPDDPDQFLHNQAQQTWANHERIHYLRELAHNIHTRLEELYQHPYRNAEQIAREQLTLEAIQEELQELESLNQVY